MMTFTGSRWRWKMEIIKVRNAEYSRYEELLLERDRLRKEARIYHGLYVKEFGELHLSLFEKQITCIKKKKMIGYYQMAINCGGVIDQAEIDALLTKEMEEYQQKLQQMLEENKAAKEMQEISSVKLLKIKRIYRRLAKQLHPDINPMTAEIPELMQLWNSVMTAYNCNNLEDMEELEILVNKALERLNMGYTEIEIPNLAEKIEAVEAEIKKIRETDPYQYKYLLEDPELVEEKRRELEGQVRSYTEYEKELDSVINEMLKSGVKIIWKIN